MAVSGYTFFSYYFIRMITINKTKSHIQSRITERAIAKKSRDRCLRHEEEEERHVGRSCTLASVAYRYPHGDHDDQKRHRHHQQPQQDEDEFTTNSCPRLQRPCRLNHFWIACYRIISKRRIPSFIWMGYVIWIIGVIQRIPIQRTYGFVISPTTTYSYYTTKEMLRTINKHHRYYGTSSMITTSSTEQEPSSFSVPGKNISTHNLPSFSPMTIVANQQHQQLVIQQHQLHQPVHIIYPNNNYNISTSDDLFFCQVSQINPIRGSHPETINIGIDPDRIGIQGSSSSHNTSIADTHQPSESALSQRQETAMHQQNSTDAVSYQVHQDVSVVTTRSMWRRRNARSTEEGIRREKVQKTGTTTTQGWSNSSSVRPKLATALAKAMSRMWDDDDIVGRYNNRRYAARTIAGLIHALAEEAQDVDVVVAARHDTPFWNKHVDEIKIQFTRLGFKPLRIGGSHVVPTLVTTSNTTNAKSNSMINNQLFNQISTVTNNLTRWIQPTISSYSSSWTEPTNALSADDVFDQMDVDKSGALDRDEIAQALNLATTTAAAAAATTITNGLAPVSKRQEILNSRNIAVVDRVASMLVELYDFNGDGVVDRTEYKSIVDDMAELQNQHNKKVNIDAWQSNSPSRNERDEMNPVAFRPTSTMNHIDSTDIMNSIAQATGSIRINDLKLDLRRLVFGAIPLLKHITPGGPLILEPFNVTINGSFNRTDIMNSVLLDAGLRRLVARALRHRVGSIRDLLEGALFHGRSWKMFSEKAPQVEVPKLTNVHFDQENRLIISGRARVQSQQDAPVMENRFLIRTRIGTRNNGRVIRLVEPELAVVLECPKPFDETVTKFCSYFNIQKPQPPKPLYSFFPIYSPFKVEDNDGFNLGEDNCIDSISIQDGALHFQLSAILRPGRFLGSHYVAFTVPARTFIVTLDRLREGIKSARLAKQRTMEEVPQQKSRRTNMLTRAAIEELVKTDLLEGKFLFRNRVKQSQRQQSKSFFSRFVDGYLQADRDESQERERVAKAIRDFFGRQATAVN